jgi:hypothetical protein
VKVELRYPVVGRRETEFGGEAVVVLLRGDFELDSPDDRAFPLEIDFADPDVRGLARRYRHLTENQSLYRAEITLSRIRKVEAALADRNKIPPTFTRQHPLFAMYDEAMNPAEGGGRRRCLLDEHSENVTLSKESVRQAFARAQRELDGLLFVDDCLWKKSGEPYFHVVKGRPKWAVVVSSNDRPYFGINEHIFGMHEYDQVRAFLGQKVAEGETVANPDFKLTGTFEYRVNSLARSVMAVARGVVGYYANRTNDHPCDEPQYRLESQSTAMLKAYLTIRTLVDGNPDDLDDEDIAAFFEAYDVIRSEGERLGVRMVQSTRAVEQQRERWLERPVHLDLQPAAIRPR